MIGKVMTPQDAQAYPVVLPICRRSLRDQEAKSIVCYIQLLTAPQDWGLPHKEWAAWQYWQIAMLTAGSQALRSLGGMHASPAGAAVQLHS